jgi:hypothetical protein
VKRVERVEDKIIAMEKHDAVQQGVLPRENRKDGISANSISLFWCKSVSQVLRRFIQLKTWGIINSFLLFIVALAPFGPLIYEKHLAPSPYMIRIVTSIDSSGFREGSPQCRIRERDTIYVLIGGDLGHGLINLSVQAQYGVVFPTMKGRYEGNKLIIPVEKGQATFRYQRNPLVNKDEDTLTIIIIRCGKGKGGFPLRLIIR